MSIPPPIHYKNDANRLKTIPGFERYSVTDDGRVISFVNPHKPIVKRTHPNNVGYHIVALYADLDPGSSISQTSSRALSLSQLLVHRLVAEAFVHNPKPQAYDSVHHLDWDKNNNHYSNLIWQPMELIRQQAHQAQRWVGNGNNGARKFSDD